MSLNIGISSRTRRVSRAMLPSITGDDLIRLGVPRGPVYSAILGSLRAAWLDGLGEDYTVRWTLNCILLGLVLGATNVYVFIRKYW